MRSRAIYNYGKVRANPDVPGQACSCYRCDALAAAADVFHREDAWHTACLPYVMCRSFNSAYEHKYTTNRTDDRDD